MSKPLTVWVVRNDVNICSTMSGASAGVGAIASIRCLNDQTPSPCVRASSTTPRLVIISSRARADPAAGRDDDEVDAAVRGLVTAG